LNVRAPRAGQIDFNCIARNCAGHASMQTLTAIIYQAPGTKWLVAQNPETGTTTQGRTLDEALANLREATELYLSEFPLPKKGRAVLTTFEVEASNA